MKSKERDKSKKREVIIKGALKIFISKGYELSSMDKIAEQAGVSKRTVYNHFGSKRKLFEVIVEDLLVQRQNFKSIKYDSIAPLEDQLISFAETEMFLVNSAQKLELSRFLTITFLNNLELQREMVQRHPTVSTALIAWLEDAKKDGRIEAENIFLAAKVFYSMVVGAITWPVLFSDGLDMKAIRPVLDEVISVFLSKYKKT